MNNKSQMLSLKERMDFVRKQLDGLSSKSEMTFADKLLNQSLDSHLSDLLAEERAIQNQHPLQDLLEMRLKGTLVDLGSIPLDILSTISGNIAGLVQKATHRISSGKDSRRVPKDIKNALDMRLADLVPGSTRLMVTFSTGSCEIVDTIYSQAMKDIFSLLQENDGDEFMEKVAEIGSNSANSLRNIITECEDNNLSFELSWIGPLSDGKKLVSFNTEAIKSLGSRLATTFVSKPWDEQLTGELAVLSMYGKLEIVSEKERIKATYPIDMLESIQKSHKVGQRVSLTASVTEVYNDILGIRRRNYIIKSFD